MNEDEPITALHLLIHVRDWLRKDHNEAHCSYRHDPDCDEAALIREVEAFLFDREPVGKGGGI